MKINKEHKFDIILKLRKMARTKDVFIDVKDFYLDFNSGELVIMYENGKEENAEKSKYALEIKQIFKPGIIID